MIFARQYYKRYPDNEVIDEREYRILMAQYVTMTTLFRCRLDPLMMSSENVKAYCKKSPPPLMRQGSMSRKTH